MWRSAEAAAGNKRRLRVRLHRTDSATEDLKARAFTLEAVGKMNFYVSVVDDRLRHPADSRTIGIVLCQSKNAIVAEYALRDIDKPLAISTYVTKLIESIPDELKKELEPPAAVQTKPRRPKKT